MTVIKMTTSIWVFEDNIYLTFSQNGEILLIFFLHIFFSGKFCHKAFSKLHYIWVSIFKIDSIKLLN